jgi:FtsH-binding integral membrane protein
MTKNKKAFVPIALVFIILNGIIILIRSFLAENGFDVDTLIYANALLFVISIAGFLFQRKGLQSPNPQAFVRGMYASMMIKLFVSMIAVLVYVLLFRNKINKPAIFAAMVMYIVYTVIEVRTLMKVARKKTNV